MKEIEHNPANPPTYECLACGAIIESETRPGECDACGEAESLRNRGFTRE
jgi:rubrerythrin